VANDRNKGAAVPLSDDIFATSWSKNLTATVCSYCIYVHQSTYANKAIVDSRLRPFAGRRSSHDRRQHAANIRQRSHV